MGFKSFKKMKTVINSTTQPTANLYEGLIWYNPTGDVTKIYLNGQFREVGGKIKGVLDLSGTQDPTNRLVIPVGVDKYAT